MSIQSHIIKLLVTVSVSGLLAANAAAQSVPEEGSKKEIMDEIVVTATGFEQNLSQAPASITLIPRAELELQRVNSLAEALSSVPGIDIGNGVGKTGGVNISIRGMPSDYSLVLVDGRRQNAAGNVTPNGFGETSSSFIPPVSAIERIEVVRGPMSTLYGSDAIGGVINIITRTSTDRLRADVGLDTTIQGDDDFGNSYNGTLYLDGLIAGDVLSFAARGRYYHREASDLSYTDVNGDPIEVSKRGPSPVKADMYSIGGRVNYTPNDDHKVWVDVDLARQTYDNTEGQLGTLGVRGYAEELKFNRDQVVVAHTSHIFGGILDSDITLNSTETLGRVLPDDVAGTDRLQGDPRQLEATNTIFNSRYFKELGDHTFTVGGQFWHAEMKDGVAADPFEHDQWAVFAEDQWQFAENFSATGGVRYDNHSEFGDHISPRAYLVWNATDALTLKGGVSKGFKTPRLEQIADGIVGFRGQGTIPFLGTPTLQPETSTTYEAGAYIRGDHGLQANVTVFHNQFNDKIATGPTFANCAFGLTQAEYDALTPSDSCLDYGYWPNAGSYSQDINVDEAETQGVEASIRRDISDAVGISANYTYTESEQKSGPNVGEPLVNTPAHQFNARLTWAVTDRLNTWLRGEYSSSRYRGLGDEQTQLGDYKSYTLFDLGGAYEVSESITLSATIYNLLNDDFVRYVPYLSDGDTAYANEYAINQEPRRLWMSVNARF
ncbi:outer membrane receptor for ferrienterochelin and colicins [Litorimonas taeanensis]|uniref:Outer membrane receptor for ferrienterochelin and colicins n=2 Tax=Litorimonas taeanensis TaxID=568099 RepID=A0A420WM89_9PROT|nr:TonB-dependent receptor [Litorimonas taeanensis]RKQ72005.1 outer membrane receptor for ferrienterochelin and colicins [Litorimonas taeanensis]